MEIAMIGQYAEKVFFGKPCGLMDQMASSVGNLVHIDFADVKNPVIERVACERDEGGSRSIWKRSAQRGFQRRIIEKYIQSP